MCEIKFRCWSELERQLCEVTSINLENGWVWFYDELAGEHQAEKIEDLIIEQFTGRYDKNKKPIYEGDVVITDECGWMAHVVYNEDCGAFICEDDLGGFASYCNWKEFEVIGNIHEAIDNHRRS